MNRALIFVIIAASACGSSKGKSDPAPTELVTRRAPPLVERPARMSATRFDVDEDLETTIEAMLTAESSSAELIVATGLTWSDGHKTAAAWHVRFPPHDMRESDFDAAVDDGALERCDTEFQDCVDGADSCQEAAYESCIRSAYRDTFVYMSSHLGIDCGILELSMYGVDGAQATLLERRVVDPMMCDYDYSGGAPSAADLDGDGGPELVYTWSSARADGWRPDEETQESIVIFDASDLTEQFRFSRDSAMDDYSERENVTGLSPLDEDGDGLFDLRTSLVTTTGYCTGYGWALDARFVIPEDATDDDPACHIEIEQKLYPYDVSRDSWMPADPAETKKGS